MKLSFFGLCLALTGTTIAQAETKAVDDVAAIQLRDDGETYDVICVDGSTEVVTADDLAANNVCPNGNTDTDPSNILSVIRNADGTFSVICVDMSREMATADDIIEGRVCNETQPDPRIVIKAGAYRQISASDPSICDDQTLEPKYDTANTLVSVKLVFTSTCSVPYANLTCTEMLCRGPSTSGVEHSIEITSDESYNYERHSDGATAKYELRPQ